MKRKTVFLTGAASVLVAGVATCAFVAGKRFGRAYPDGFHPLEAARSCAVSLLEGVEGRRRSGRNLRDYGFDCDFDAGERGLVFDDEAAGHSAFFDSGSCRDRMANVAKEAGDRFGLYSWNDCDDLDDYDRGEDDGAAPSAYAFNLEASDSEDDFDWDVDSPQA